MRATGIAGHTHVLYQLHKLGESRTAVAVVQNPNAGATVAEIEGIMVRYMSSVHAPIEPITPTNAPLAPSAPTAVVPTAHYSDWSWGGQVGRAVPENFSFPTK